MVYSIKNDLLAIKPATLDLLICRILAYHMTVIDCLTNESFEDQVSRNMEPMKFLLQIRTCSFTGFTKRGRSEVVLMKWNKIMSILTVSCQSES